MYQASGASLSSRKGWAASTSSKASPSVARARTSARSRTQNTVSVWWYFSGAPALRAKARIAAHIRSQASSIVADSCRYAARQAKVLAMVEILIAYLPALERTRVFAIGHGSRPRRTAEWITRGHRGPRCCAACTGYTNSRDPPGTHSRARTGPRSVVAVSRAPEGRGSRSARGIARDAQRRSRARCGQGRCRRRKDAAPLQGRAQSQAAAPLSSTIRQTPGAS